LAASSMLRLNSTVMALSPLGKRRGGGSVAAMASKLSRSFGFAFEQDLLGKPVPAFPDHALVLSSTCSVFWTPVEFTSREIRQ
jgi:hypothetical protein